MKLQLPLLACLLVSLAATPALAKPRQVNVGVPAQVGGAVVFASVSGSLQVTTWDKDEVRVRGTIGPGVTEVRHEAHGDTVRISVELEEDTREGWAKLELRVPARSRLDVSVVSADVTASGELGRVQLKGVSSDVRIDGRADEIDVSTVGGDLAVGAQTQRMNLGTVSGDVIASAARGEVEGKTVSGEVKIAGGPFARVKIGTVSGDIEIAGALAGGGPFKLTSQSGDVTLRTPGSDKLRFRLKSFSGDIANDLESSPDGVPVEVNCFSGDIRVTR